MNICPTMIQRVVYTYHTVVQRISNKQCENTQVMNPYRAAPMQNKYGTQCPTTTQLTSNEHKPYRHQNQIQVGSFLQNAGFGLQIDATDCRHLFSTPARVAEHIQ